jgi:hypothetical protein
MKARKISRALKLSRNMIRSSSRDAAQAAIKVA